MLFSIPVHVALFFHTFYEFLQKNALQSKFLLIKDHRTLYIYPYRRKLKWYFYRKRGFLLWLH